MKIRLYFLTSIFLLLSILSAQAEDKQEFTIALLLGPEGETLYHQQAVLDINTLLANRVTVEYRQVYIKPDQEKESLDIIGKLMDDQTIDCIIGIGIEQSELLVRQKRFNKPTIAATILDRKLQGLPVNEKGASGIHNFNYIQSPFDVERDLKAFKQLYDFKHLGVLAPSGQTLMFSTLINYFGKAVEAVSPSANLSFIEVDPDNIAESLSQISEHVDSVYILPLFPEEQSENEQKMITKVNQLGLPSFALVGEEHVQMGAMAAIAPDRNFDAMTRRIAINVLEISDGKNAGSLPVSVSKYADNFVVNVETLRTIKYYPRFKTLREARLLNLEKLHQGAEINLKGVVFEALERNLNLKIEQANTQIQAKEADIAASALLPQVDLSTSTTHVDENRVKISKTIPARTTWSTAASVSQVLFSDDILANQAIQEILLESQKYQEKATLMDTVITAVEAYLSLLSAQSVQIIQNNNLEVTRRNLDIAKNKAAVGSVDASEVNRWQSEKANNLIQLNDAYRDLQLSRMSLNQILNRPIKREYTPLDIEPATGIELLVTDPEIYHLVGNFKQLERFSNFLIQEANTNLPELKQIRQSLKSEERRLLNRKRAIYLPDVALSGNLNKILSEHDAVSKTPTDLDHPWTLSLTATWPLYTGGSNKKQIAQSRIALRQIQMQEQDLRNRLHLSVRSNLETAAVSAREIELSEEARDSAKKSFEIIQAGYAEGRNSVTDLIDAQNAMTTSERNAALAKYQFVIDFLNLERSIGRFHFLSTPGEKQLFLTRLREYMVTDPAKGRIQ